MARLNERRAQQPIATAYDLVADALEHLYDQARETFRPHGRLPRLTNDVSLNYHPMTETLSFTVAIEAGARRISTYTTSWDSWWLHEQGIFCEWTQAGLERCVREVWNDFQNRWELESRLDRINAELGIAVRRQGALGSRAQHLMSEMHRIQHHLEVNHKRRYFRPASLYHLHRRYYQERHQREEQRVVSQELAQTRGMKLLLSCLSPQQREQYAAYRYFDVIGSDSGHVFRIHQGRQMNIVENPESAGCRGWCFLPEGYLVEGDCMLAQKIALENEEKKTLQRAHKMAPTLVCRA